MRLHQIGSSYSAQGAALPGISQQVANDTSRRRGSPGVPGALPSPPQRQAAPEVRAPAAARAEPGAPLPGRGRGTRLTWAACGWRDPRPRARRGCRRRRMKRAEPEPAPLQGAQRAAYRQPGR
ncbi:hypothetical protein KIL84_020099 [Mauremys mutica]|uniref:Uncharacterized protein n=1 Tax=Mauremys mutica TaxID=74926 RepID=A0A9D4BB81_9SAUR|nr:hypothetical protein KIL84_020099 [Mauremys mutica]